VKVLCNKIPQLVTTLTAEIYLIKKPRSTKMTKIQSPTLLIIKKLNKQINYFQT